jgi:DNA-binding transcriptional LysR family regulator
MTQPLTRQIKCLEAVLKRQLFSRSTHDVSLTEAGRALVVKAEKILREISELKRIHSLLKPPYGSDSRGRLILNILNR